MPAGPRPRSKRRTIQDYLAREGQPETFDVLLRFNSLYELQCMRHILSAGNFAVQSYANKDLHRYAMAYEKVIDEMIRTTKENLRRGMAVAVDYPQQEAEE